MTTETIPHTFRARQEHTLGPRRILALLGVLALTAVAGTATMAFASDGPGTGPDRVPPSERRAEAAGAPEVPPTADSGHNADPGDSHGGPGDHAGPAAGSSDDGGANGPSVNSGGANDGGANSGGSSDGGANSGGSNDGGSDVGVAEVPDGVTGPSTGGIGSSAGIPPAPGEAPAAAASGPAPDAAAAAPVLEALTAVAVPTNGTGGNATDGGATAAPAAPAVPAAPPVAAAALPDFGALGVAPNAVPDPPSAARELLSTGAGRSLAVLVGLLAAIGVFLFVHRRADRGDRKLAAARSGPDLSRFR
jgi:hypothetical protein